MYAVIRDEALNYILYFRKNLYNSNWPAIVYIRIITLLGVRTNSNNLPNMSKRRGMQEQTEYLVQEKTNPVPVKQNTVL